MPRPFASGSRQAPDPYDQYLEQQGFYRKHTARDSSCLFRTISEQMYATQMHHLVIRQRCVDYMRKHKHFFQKSVDKDINEYLDELSKPKTYGTLLELRAIAYLYRRNVILFEAYNTGTFMVKDNYFSNVFRVFFTPEKHFDTVFTSDYIEAAAFCQGICYEILYKNVFKLPDVMYAVEQMLHGNSLEFIKSKTHYVGPYAKKISFADGREFELNAPENTNCILDNNVLCHFHNPNFPQFADNLHNDMHIVEASQYDNQKITKTLDSLLPEKYTSCVQQLLKDGITPFPYKVAKALDPDIYRNVEFDAWSEMRKEQRFKNWYLGGNNLQVGVKCLVKLGSSSHSNLYNCHIQDMAPDKGPCLVYIEELAEKHTVPYEALQPLPSDLAKPWPLPFRYQKHIERSPEKNPVNEVKRFRKVNGISRCRDISTIKKEIYDEDDVSSEKNEVSYQLKQFTSLQHYCPPSYEVLAMPLSVDHSSSSNNINNDNLRQSRRNSTNSAVSHLTAGTDLVKQENKKDDENDLEYNVDNCPSYNGYEGFPEAYYTYQYESVHPAAHNSFYCMYNGPQYPPPPPPGPVVPHGVFMQPTIPVSQPNSNGYYANPSGALPLPPPAFLSTSSSAPSNTMTTNICRNHGGMVTTVSGRVNFGAGRSILSSGGDLPQDIPTLRFFYNLGNDYYKVMPKNNNSGETGAPSPYDYHKPRSQMMKCILDANGNNDKNDSTTRLAHDFQTNLRLEKDTSLKWDQYCQNNNNHQNSKRFSSRYFNNKRNEKNSFRPNGGNGNNNNQRSSHVDSHGKQAPGPKNHNNPTPPSTSVSSNASSSGKTSTTNVTNSGETTPIQTTPNSTVVTAETWSNEFINSIPFFSAQAGPMPYNGQCIPVYADNEGQQGVFVQPAPATIMTLPYGMYPIPQPAHPGANFQAYLPPPGAPIHVPPPPPSFSTNAFLAPAGNDSSPMVVNSEPIDNGAYSYMSYPPVYYSPTNNGGAVATNGTPVQTGYWYTAAPPQYQTSVTPTTVAHNNTISTSSAPSIA